MEWSERMNAAVNYIEDNLDGTLDFKGAANLACCSLFHFQRMFYAILGCTPAEYARKRRLTMAARELTSSKVRVIDIALKYGYDSPDSFARAFRNVHGVTPQAARAPGVKLSAFPRISFNIELKGGVGMDYRIVEKKEFSMALIKKKFNTTGGQNFIKIPQWWQEYLKSPDCTAMEMLTGGECGAVTGGCSLGICIEPDEIKDPLNYEFYYGIGVEIPDGNDVGKFEKYVVPAGTWAVFDCNLENLQDVTRRIFSEWFPSTGYEHAPAPEIEVYFPENLAAKEMPCQIWIPVVKKK